MKKILSIFLCSILLTSVIALSGCEKKDKQSLQNKEKIEKITLPNTKGDVIELSLYFDSSEDNNKIEIVKEERLIKKQELLGELIIQELVKGPSVNGKLRPVLPKQTRLLSFSIKDKIAFVNLSKEASVKVTPEKEKACIKSLVWSLTELSSVDKVKILIGNKNVDSLGGNYLISQPLSRNSIDSLKKKQ